MGGEITAIDIGGDGEIEHASSGCNGAITRIECEGDIQVTSIASTVAFGSPTVTPGSVTIQPNGFGGASVGSPSIVDGGVPSCTLCSTWMTENASDNIDGEDVYLLTLFRSSFVPPLYATIQECKDGINKTRSVIDDANLCTVEAGSNFVVLVYSEDVNFSPNPQTMTVSEFQSLDEGPYDPNNKTWRVYFRCSDQE